MCRSLLARSRRVVDSCAETFAEIGRPSGPPSDGSVFLSLKYLSRAVGVRKSPRHASDGETTRNCGTIGKGARHVGMTFTTSQRPRRSAAVCFSDRVVNRGLRPLKSSQFNAAASDQHRMTFSLSRDHVRLHVVLSRRKFPRAFCLGNRFRRTYQFLPDRSRAPTQ